jgi:hypothetical protein
LVKRQPSGVGTVLVVLDIVVVVVVVVVETVVASEGVAHPVVLQQQIRVTPLAYAEHNDDKLEVVKHLSSWSIEGE